MEGVLAQFDWPSTTAWAVFALATPASAVLLCFANVRQAFRKRRLDRRLARDPYILREELNEYRLAIGEDLEPLKPLEVIKGSLVLGASGAFAYWLIERELDHVWEMATTAVLILGLVFGLWRRLNDPGPSPDELAEREIELSGEQVISFGSAVAIVCLILLGVLIWF